jgi:biotin---protein ligase
VLVTTVHPPVKVRVQGITLDYGYLHTVSVDGGESIDLKPDGNSYDMMAGLIRAKT